VYTAARQLVYTAIGLFAGVEALESWRRHELQMARGLAVAAGVMAVFLLVSSVVSRPRRR
jgi:hypothetical protein